MRFGGAGPAEGCIGALVLVQNRDLAVVLTISFIARSALTFEGAKLDWPKSVLRFVCWKSNYFLGRGYGGGFSARRRWRFDTSIFRISKVDPPINPLRNRILTFRDPVLDHLFTHFLNLWKPSNWRWWRQIKIKVQFDDSLEPILSASTTNLFSVFHPFWPINCASRSCRARCI